MNLNLSLFTAVKVLRVFPPGLAGFTIQQLVRHDNLEALAAIAALGAYAAVLAAVLNRRLRAQFLGENLSEASAPVITSTGKKIRLGWNLPFVSSPIAAIFEKEARYLMRSGPVLFMFVMPVIILFIFHITPGRNSGAGIFSNMSTLAFPLGSAYALLMLTNIVYNSFGTDGAGLQFFLFAPVSLRDVMLAKNLVACAVFTLNMLIVYVATAFLYGPPQLNIIFITLAAVAFAFPLNLAAGNLMSVYSPQALRPRRLRPPARHRRHRHSRHAGPGW